MFTALTYFDIFAIAWFALCYFGYDWAVRYGPLKDRKGLVAAIQERRQQWMQSAAQRDVRIMDSQLLMNLSSGNAFFASTTVIVLGGLTAMLGAADNVKNRLEQFPYVVDVPLVVWEFKIIFLMALVIRAFFKFAWAFRLTHYLGTMLGAMPRWEASTAVQCEKHAAKTAQLAGITAMHSNDGLRTVYFAIAGLGWFLHSLVFIIGCAWVLAIVYRREYASRALMAIEDNDEE